ncbi:MAG TPA: TlpA family protein disulfide reductase [Candidatus Polarisedimenticolaceae bacterium]
MTVQPRVAVLLLLFGSLWAASSARCAPAGAPAAPPAPSSVAKVGPAVPGAPFPAWTYTNLNPAAGPAKVDLATVLGKQPVMLVYWIAGNLRSEQVLREAEALGKAAGPRLAVFSIASPPMGSSDVNPIRQRLSEMKIQIPCLNDEGFRLAQQLAVKSVPSISLVDASGVLRLVGAGSPKQSVEYKLTVADAIKRLGQTGQLGTYGELPRYEPVVELFGTKPPAFDLPAAEDGIPRSSKSLLASDKINVFVFWAIDCPHCTQFMPKLNAWVKDHRDGVNVVSLARVMNDTLKTRTQEFVRLNGFVFPTLIDKDFAVAQQYNVIATPTILILRPDGTADSIMPASETDFDKFFAAKKKALLGKS